MLQPALVQNLSFPGEICRKSALDWSQDNKISFCTSKCVYILSSYCSPVETGFPLPLHKQVIPAPKTTLDIGLFSNIHPKSIGPAFPEPLYHVLLDHTLVPQKNAQFLGYRCAKWSPKGAGADGSCLLATLTMDHRLVLYKEKDREWESVCDLSEVLSEMHKSLWKEANENGDDVTDNSFVPSHEILYNKDTMESATSTAKNRTYNLSAMEITWTNMFGTTSSISEGTYKWCYLIVAMKSGHIMWWKVSPDDNKVVSLAYEWDPNIGLLTSICWQQTTPHSGFIVCGTLKGLLTFTPVVIRPDGKDPKLVIKPICNLWQEEDMIRVDHIAVLKTSVKKYIIIAAKQSFLISCEVFMTETDTRIKNIGHSSGMHKFPVTGLAVVDAAMPQSHLLLSSMDGLLIKIKVTAKQDAIEFHHEAIQLDLDLRNHMIQGLGISPNGLLCSLVLNTAVWFDHLVKREPLLFVSFMNKSFEEIFADFERILKPQFAFIPSSSNSICKYVDYLECVRINLASDSPTPELFQNLINWDPDSYKTFSDVDLYFVRFVLKCYVSGLAKTLILTNCVLQTKLEAVESVIMQNYITRVVSSCYDKIDLLTPAQGQSLLLMADWLYMQYKKPVHNLYEAFGYDCPSDVESIPPRETCRICQLPVKLMNMRYGECEKKHKFGRCCQSLILCDVTPYYQCLSCKSMALEDVWSSKFICTYCSFPMTR